MMRNEQNNVIFIDSDCPVCNKFAVYVSRYDNSEKYRFASLNLVTDDKTSIVLISNGRVSDKSSAILKILIGLKGFHVLLGLGYIVPKFLRDFIYDKFSVNRLRFFKESDSCNLDLRERILDRNSIDGQVLELGLRYGSRQN